MDSQANIHLVGDLNYLFDRKRVEEINFQAVGIENIVEWRGSQLVEIKDVDGNNQYFKVDEVYYTSALEKDQHLISEVKFSREFGAKHMVFDGGKSPGYSFEQPGSKNKSKSGKPVQLKLTRENDLRVLHGRLVPAEEAQQIMKRGDVTIITQQVETGNKTDYDLDETVAFGASVIHESGRAKGKTLTLLDAHYALGHAPMDVVKKIAEENKWKAIDSGQSCVECTKTVLRKKPDKKNKQPNSTFRSQLDADLMGTRFKKGVGGRQYLLVVVDNRTNYVESEATPDKAAEQVAGAFNSIITQTNIRHRPGATVLKTDRGTEFMGPEFRDNLAANGIEHKQRPKDHPAKNGKAERMCGILMDKAKQVLSTSQLGTLALNQQLWPYLFKYVTMQYNCTARSGPGNVSPYEAATGNEPPFNFIASRFGATCWILNKDSKKQDNNALEARFLYYDLSQQFYYVYVISTKRVQHSFDVHFLLDHESVPTSITSEDFQDLIDEAAGSETDVETDGDHDEDNNNSDEDSEQDEQQDVTNIDELPPLVSLVAKLARLLYQANSAIRDKPNRQDIEDFLVEPEVLQLLQASSVQQYLGKLRVSDTPSIREALTSSNAAEWMKSLEAEISNITKHATKLTKAEVEQHLKKDKTLRVVPTQILCKIKRLADNTIDKLKTRIVALGNLTEQVGDSYAPNSGPYDFRTFVAATHKIGSRYVSFDCSGAYLNAEMDPYIITIREIYDNKKQVIREQESYLMTRALYGLIESGNAWWNTYKDFLVNDLKFTCMCMSICIYKFEDHRGTIYAYVHTDDFLLAYSNRQLMDYILDKTKSRFTITIDEDVKQFLGMKIDITHDSISLSQTKYIDKLIEDYNVSTEKCTPLPADVKYDKSQCPPEAEIGANDNQARKQQFN